MRIFARVQFRLLWCLLVAWLMSVCLPQAAWAELITVTITGTVDRGTDVTGVFLSPNTSFTGQNFTLVFTFDDSKGTETVENCAGVPCGSGDSGSTYTDAPGAPLTSLSPGTAVLTINGISFAFGTSSALTSSYSTVGRFLPFEGNPGSVSFDIDDYYPNGGAGVSATIFPASGTPPLSTNYDWRSPFTDSQLASDGVGGNNGAVNLGSLAITFSNPAIQASADLNFNSITVSGGSPSASEPAKTLGNAPATRRARAPAAIQSASAPAICSSRSPIIKQPDPTSSALRATTTASAASNHLRSFARHRTGARIMTAISELCRRLQSLRNGRTASN